MRPIFFYCHCRDTCFNSNIRKMIRIPIFFAFTGCKHIPTQKKRTNHKHDDKIRYALKPSSMNKKEVWKMMAGFGVQDVMSHSRQLLWSWAMHNIFNLGSSLVEHCQSSLLVIERAFFTFTAEYNNRRSCFYMKQKMNNNNKIYVQSKQPVKHIRNISNENCHFCAIAAK